MSWNVNFTTYANLFERDVDAHFECPYIELETQRQYSTAKIAVLALGQALTGGEYKGAGPVKLTVNAVGHVRQRDGKDETQSFVNVSVAWSKEQDRL